MKTNAIHTTDISTTPHNQVIQDCIQFYEGHLTEGPTTIWIKIENGEVSDWSYSLAPSTPMEVLEDREAWSKSGSIPERCFVLDSELLIASILDPQDGICGFIHEADSDDFSWANSEEELDVLDEDLKIVGYDDLDQGSWIFRDDFEKALEEQQTRRESEDSSRV